MCRDAQCDEQRRLTQRDRTEPLLAVGAGRRGEGSTIRLTVTRTIATISQFRCGEIGPASDLASGRRASCPSLGARRRGIKVVVG